MPEFIYSVFQLRNGVEFRESSLLPPLQSATRTAVEAWVLANCRPLPRVNAVVFQLRDDRVVIRIP